MKKQRQRIHHPVSSPFASPKAVVQQHMKQESDINQIVERARRGIPPTNVRSPGVFADVSNTPQDLTAAFSQVESAWEAFNTLPARARDELSNDPRRLASANADFFIRHGLTVPKEEPQAKPGAHQESEGGRPSGKEAKPPKASKKPSTPEPEAQD